MSEFIILFNWININSFIIFREKLENLGFIWELPQPKKKKKNSDVAVEIFSDGKLNSNPYPVLVPLSNLFLDEGEDFDFSENEISKRM